MRKESRFPARHLRGALGAVLGGTVFLSSGCVESSVRDFSSGHGVMVPSGNFGGVCFLKMNRKYAVILEQKSSGSGALVNRRYVLTAAHSLLDPPSSAGSLRTIELAVGKADVTGMDEDSADRVVSRVQDDMDRLPRDLVWNVSSNYLAGMTHRSVKKSSETLVRHDYGFVDLGASFGRANSFALVPAEGRLKVGIEIKIAGYPGESRRVKGATGSKLFVGEGKVTVIRGSLFGYDIKTSKGVSGGPVWIEKGGRRYLVGIHLGSDIGGIDGAVGRMIDQTMVKEFAAWVRQRGVQ